MLARVPSVERLAARSALAAAVAVNHSEQRAESVTASDAGAMTWRGWPEEMGRRLAARRAANPDARHSGHRRRESPGPIRSTARGLPPRLATAHSAFVTHSPNRTESPGGLRADLRLGLVRG